MNPDLQSGSKLKPKWDSLFQYHSEFNAPLKEGLEVILYKEIKGLQLRWKNAVLFFCFYC